MSLDGFIAGPNHAMDWIFDLAPGAAHEIDDDIVQSTGAVLVGRRTFGVGERSTRPETSGLYGGRWQGPQFVLTHNPPDHGPDPAITFLSGDIRAAVSTARGAAGGKNVLVLGANVVGQCLEAGLIDAFRIHLAPVLLGGGVRMFEISPERPLALETVRVSRSGPLATLDLDVVRPD